MRDTIPEETDFGEDVTLKPLSIHPEEYITLDTIQKWYRWISTVTIRDVDLIHYKQLGRLADFPKGTVFEIYSTSPKEEENTH